MVERGNCGLGFVADQFGRASHGLLRLGLQALINLEHRGALDADARTGDGAGVLTPLPRKLFAREAERLTGRSSDPDQLAVGVFFLSPEAAEECLRLAESALAAQGLGLVCWREVPVHPEHLGARARATQPRILQAILCDPSAAISDFNAPITGLSARSFERRLYLARRQFERDARPLGAYVPSLSSRTIVYKGLLLAPQLPAFYADLGDPDYEAPLAVFHQRYSTNTLPTWERAQPFRRLCHNGEINTLQGNLAWMQAREPLLRGPFGAEEAARLRPVADTDGSDSAMLDNAVELLTMSGRDLRHAVTMLSPPAWEKLPDLPAAVRDFYAYHACLTEPWDGPAALAFTDGTTVGAALDRYGLRPCRYLVTDDGLVAAASEAGAVPIEDERISLKGRLGPGQMLAVDTLRHTVLEDGAIKRELAARRPYGQWVRAGVRTLKSQVPSLKSQGFHDGSSLSGAHAGATPGQPLIPAQIAFGYTSEELAVVLKPMMQGGAEPVGSMGDDTPSAVLSDKPRPLFAYFRQRFAEVTNPPIDPLREEIVMSLRVKLGARGDFLAETPEQARLVELDSPILTDEALAALKADPELRTVTLSTLFPAVEGPAGLEAALDRLDAAAEAAVRAGAQAVVLSDRGVDERHTFIPALLALGAVHHHLLRAEVRTLADLIVESGEPREVHHLAALVGYGAAAVHPYLALATAASQPDREFATANYLHALAHGLLKIMSKMGISTADAYCGAQIFEVIGLGSEVVEKYFTGTPAHLEGLGLAGIAQIGLRWHAAAFGVERPSLESQGFYKFKRSGEIHAFSPALVHALHAAVKSPGALNGRWPEGYAAYKHYSRLDESRAPVDPHDLLAVEDRRRPRRQERAAPAATDRPDGEDGRAGEDGQQQCDSRRIADEAVAAPALSLDEVEPAAAILRRISTAAMSHGALSAEAHETMAIAMNRLGALSNSGEGGEHPARYWTESNDRIKQVASARFGVTAAYLASADELQIKMAQGSKPGEGGQLPGHKVTAEIAAIRHATPGVALISPPPHHDIYSIEDLAQLIFDLRQVNPRAAISVKLVAQAGVGTIAAGVAKAGADVIVISGNSGGTGASPLGSIKHAGAPWEIGLAEAQRALIAGGLRGRARLRTDGGLRTGRDVVIAALLGADEFTFGTAAVVAEGCLMARACHLNTCPTGIATQRPDLRAKFDATPEQVMVFFRYVAEEVREVLAGLGLRSLAEATGRVDRLRQAKRGRADEECLDLSRLLAEPGPGPRRYMHEPNRVPRESPLDETLLEAAKSQIPNPKSQSIVRTYHITNRDRTFGARLAGEIARVRGDVGLPEGAVRVNLQGSAGQSFGAFALPGMELALCGEANDYVGKGMAGGRITICPPPSLQARAPVLAGNAVLYGATGGQVYIAGRAGERFAVRNSGADAVVEGVGDHGCEYMTGGAVAVLGPIGYNFAAGMTGGTAWLLDALPRGGAAARVNPELVQAVVPDAGELEELRYLICEHARLTGSRVAQSLLAGWPAASARFVMIVPKGRPERVEASSGRALAEPAAVEVAMAGG